MGVSLTYEQGNYVTIDAAVLITVLLLLFMHKLQRTRGRELEVSSVDQSTVTGCPKDQIKSNPEDIISNINCIIILERMEESYALLPTTLRFYVKASYHH